MQKRKDKRILILCTSNSCRSQMAAGFLKSFDSDLEVYSAGTKPARKVNPLAIQVMKEAGIDISSGVPRPVERFINEDFDYVITVCDSAKESCPNFTGKVKNRFHIGFNDPAMTAGNETEVIYAFKKVRDEIKKEFYLFYCKNFK
ncbi:MAG: arsenate reductase ArsC [Bacteroidetes bacterium]|nr:arsenate reductase ArsC [Bacteroidota bacterium]